MDDLKTLQDVCKSIGVTRRAVQGYEVAGLVSSVDKNKYGHLLYGTDEQKRIAKIKMYQDLRFTIKEIKELIDAPNYIVKGALERQIKRLRTEKKELEAFIANAEAMIEALYEEVNEQ